MVVIYPASLPCYVSFVFSTRFSISCPSTRHRWLAAFYVKNKVFQLINRHPDNLLRAHRRNIPLDS